MDIEPLGDSALLVRIVAEFDREKSLDALLAAAQALNAEKIPGLVEIVPAYTTIALFFDPARNDFGEVRARIEHALQILPPARAGSASTIEVPVCYDPEFAIDLDEVARHAGLSADEVIKRHSSATYRVSCVGFTPGFPFLSGLPVELATPRRSSPRKEIPAGAVAIGGTQTGIYPRKSPGGWNIIGRTPVRLFDVKRQPPALFRAGDHVRFRGISRDEFEQIST
jgi:inhibitor of KinA